MYVCMDTVLYKYVCKHSFITHLSFLFTAIVTLLPRLKPVFNPVTIYRTGPTRYLRGNC